MSTNPCCHDCDFTDGSEPQDDTGCCTPLPVTIPCGAPVLPVPECDEEDPVVTFDEETEEFTVLTNLYDTLCSAITDSVGSVITTPIG